DQRRNRSGAEASETYPGRRRGLSSRFGARRPGRVGAAVVARPGSRRGARDRSEDARSRSGGGLAARRPEARGRVGHGLRGPRSPLPLRLRPDSPAAARSPGGGAQPRDARRKAGLRLLDRALRVRGRGVGPPRRGIAATGPENGGGGPEGAGGGISRATSADRSPLAGRAAKAGFRDETHRETGSPLAIRISGNFSKNPFRRRVLRQIVRASKPLR